MLHSKLVCTRRFAVLLGFLLASLSSFASQEPCSPSVERVPLILRPTSRTGVGLTISQLAELRLAIPAGRVLRLAVELSSGKFLLLHESDNRDLPDAQLVILQDGKVESRFALSALPLPEKDLDVKWRKWFGAFEYAHACTGAMQIVYVAFEAGNSGGTMVAIVQSKNDAAKILSLGDVTRGRLLVSGKDPSQLQLWSVAPRDAMLCTGCPKHYTVTTIDLSAGSVVVRDKKTTKEAYNGDEFQDHPLVFADFGPR